MLEEIIKTKFFILSSANSKNQVIKIPLRELVKKSLKYYLLHLDGKEVHNLYELALSELEQPLLDIIMQHTRGNQTRAASIMGINRSTLRKKLKKYGMN